MLGEFMFVLMTFERSILDLKLKLVWKMGGMKVTFVCWAGSATGLPPLVMWRMLMKTITCNTNSREHKAQCLRITRFINSFLLFYLSLILR
jgi:hypothetical protein